MKSENTHAKKKKPSIFENWQLEYTSNRNLIKLKILCNFENKDIPSSSVKTHGCFSPLNASYRLELRMPGFPWVLLLALILTRCVHLGIPLMSLGLLPSSIKEEGRISLDVSNAMA